MSTRTYAPTHTHTQTECVEILHITGTPERVSPFLDGGGMGKGVQEIRCVKVKIRTMVTVVTVGDLGDG